jgi:Fe2+ transport system protein FeoA
MSYSEFPRITSLSNLIEGETGRIIQVRGKPEEHRNFYGMGLAMGRFISVCGTETTPQGLALTVKSGDKITRLTDNLANNIKVQVPR